MSFLHLESHIQLHLSYRQLYSPVLDFWNDAVGTLNVCVPGGMCVFLPLLFDHLSFSLYTEAFL